MDPNVPQGSNPERLYVDEHKSVPIIAKRMKEGYNFDALPHQYKYQLKKWGITKSVPAARKEEAIKAVGKRARDAISTPTIRYKGEEIDKKRIRRYIKDQERYQDDVQLANNVFMYWNQPYKAFGSSPNGPMNHGSPFKQSASTPSDLSVASPHFAGNGGSPRNVMSPKDAPSPTMELVKTKIATDRARLFIQGRYNELFATMQKQEKKIMTGWAYQFWLFSYETAKHWGRGPQDWTTDILRFDEFQDKAKYSLENTPKLNTKSPANDADPSCTEDYEAASRVPSTLCRWSIHTSDDVEYERIPLPSPPLEMEFDLENEDSWPAWHPLSCPQTIMEKLQTALETNSFSSFKVKDLPLETRQIVKAIQRSPNELLEQAFGFCIMARNEDLLYDMIKEIRKRNIDVNGIFPYHLATTYLNGGKSCCNVLRILLEYSSSRELSFTKSYVNQNGHTVLDNLMIAIIRAHTSCPPVVLGNEFGQDTHLPGEEVDLCGRWDADSDCVRDLLANGKSTIPHKWKHMFCHTSVQTICHSIDEFPSLGNLTTSSGLYTKLCSNCGRRLWLTSLHALVVTAFHLALRGYEGETLFGMVACLVCILVNGVDSSEKVHISIDLLLGLDSATDKCSHKEMDVLQFMDQIPGYLMSNWSDDVKLGWNVFHSILEHSQATKGSTISFLHGGESLLAPLEDLDNENVLSEGSELDSEESFNGEDICSITEEIHADLLLKCKSFGTLWAAIQTEFLTYRRIAEGDPWISENFDMENLWRGLESGCEVSVRLVKNDMMKEHCGCGRFMSAHAWCTGVQEACAYYFSNMEDWNRTTFLNPVEY